MKRYFTGVWGIVTSIFKRFMRDKMALFFTFLFPLIFLLIFGSIFNNKSISFDVAVINHSQTEFAKKFVEGAKNDDKKLLKIKDVSGMDEAREKLKRSEINGIIVLPEDFGKAGADHRPSGTMRVLYAKGSEQSGSALNALLGQVTDEINKRMGQPEAPFKVASEEVGDKALSNFDYTFTGLLAFSLMSMGLFGLASQMPTEKQKGSYRRLRASPFTSGQLLMGTTLVYTVIAMISAASMMLVGALVFKFQMRGDWLVFVPFLALAAAMMTSLGLMVGSWARTENQAAPLVNSVSFPMMFLSGAFFPAYLFPEWLKGVSQFIPMTYVVDGFRLIMTENAGFIGAGMQFIVVAAITVVVYFISTRIFRWE